MRRIARHLAGNHLKGQEFSLFGFLQLFAKNKCAKLGIANTGFSNPQKGEENKKLKTVSSSLNCFYETLFLSARTFLETEKLFVCRKIVFGIVTGRIEHNVPTLYFSLGFETLSTEMLLTKLNVF